MIEENKNNKSVIDFLKWSKKGFEYHRDKEKVIDAQRDIY